jgi:hypothetical protein
VSIEFSAPTTVKHVQDFLVELRERSLLPFYLMSRDHARMFVQRAIWRELAEQEASRARKPLTAIQERLSASQGFIQPSMWSCPITMTSSHVRLVALFAFCVDRLRRLEEALLAQQLMLWIRRLSATRATPSAARPSHTAFM